jgi:hypothetical protein
MKNRINDEEKTKRKREKCTKCVTPEAYSSGAPSQRGSIPRRNEVSLRVWLVEKWMRVQVWLSWRIGRWCAKLPCFQAVWSDTLWKHWLVRQTWAALVVVSFITVLRLLTEGRDNCRRKFRQILGGPGIHFLCLASPVQPDLHSQTPSCHKTSQASGAPSRTPRRWRINYRQRLQGVKSHRNAPLFCQFVLSRGAPSAKVSGNPTAARA